MAFYSKLKLNQIIASIKLIGSIQSWSDPEDLKDDAFVLSSFENKFVRLKSLNC